MHSTLTRQSQPKGYTRSSVFVAEVASNCHEALLSAHLAHALARGVLDGDEGAAGRCSAFVAAGDSVDAPEPVGQAFAVLFSLVDSVEELLPA